MYKVCCVVVFFFFQAEDGIRDLTVTGVQTCALPILVFLTIWYGGRQVARRHREGKAPSGFGAAVEAIVLFVRNDVAIANIGHDGAKFEIGRASCRERG